MALSGYIVQQAGGSEAASRMKHLHIS